MGTFRYRGRRGGQPVLGRLEAASSEAVASHLAGLGIVPVEIVADAESEDVLRTLREWLGRRRVSSQDLIVFARQMNTMTRSGLPILRAIRAIAETTHSPVLVDALRDVLESLEAGRELASALGQHPDVFSQLFVNTVHMGEQTGRLEEAFAQLAEYLQVERETQKRIKTATRYPMLVIGGVVIAIAILNVFALPVFAEIFAEFDAELPWITRLLIASSDFTRAYWPHLLVVTTAALLGLRAWLRGERGRRLWARRKLRLPVVGSILERASFARFARTFSLSLESGVPLIQALRISASVVDNVWLEEQLVELREGIERGDTLTRTASASGLFPPLVLQMMSVGEETGSLDSLLREVAIFYEGEVDYELKRLAEAIEPILIVAIGALVLLLALGVYLPMWDLAGAARGG